MDSNNRQQAFIMNSSSTFKGYFYQGTDKEFHYFVSKWDLKKDMLFKLKTEDLEINEPYDFGTNEIRIDLFNSDKLFGQNQFYNLYIIE